MSHEVETMAWTNEVPWHGLGKNSKAKTIDGWLTDAGLDWDVSKQPMFWASEKFAAEVVKAGSVKTTIHKARLVNSNFALVRDKDDKVLDVVGPDYTPRQNRDVLGFFKEFTDAGKATMETAGSLRGGEIVWALANLNDSFTLRGGDKVKGYLLAVSYHRQGKANLFKMTTVRVVCANTLAMSLKNGGGFKDYHSTSFDAKQIERAKEALGIARDQLHEFEAAAKKLQSIKLGLPSAIGVIATVFEEGFADLDVKEAKLYVDELDKRASKSVQQIMMAYEKAPGATPGDAWGVLNGVTYWCDHIASRSPDRRLTNAWLGKTSRQKELVFDHLMEMV